MDENGRFKLSTQTFGKFCSICKLANDVSATVCQHCGAPFNPNLRDAPTTQRTNGSFELTEELRDQVVGAYTPPPVGLALFLLNSGDPIALSRDAEFVLGRGTGSKTEPIIDLTTFDGFAAGVSRRHAMVQAVANKYVLIDLNSSNGTWVNGERLLPTKPHDLPSGGVIQLGRLKLVVVYSHPPSSKKA